MNIFSFKGRIRRRDYWIISIGVGFGNGLLAPLAEHVPIVFLLGTIVLLWILYAIGAKRCHDLGHNGFWQLIPFYQLWMAFQKGMSGINEYGSDPKMSN